MVKPRTVSFLIGILLLSMLVSGVQSPASAQDGNDTTITFIMGQWMPDVLEPFFEDFEEETGITVEYEAYPFRELFETIQIRQEAQSTKVDVVLVDAPVTASYATKGYLKPLDPFFTQREKRQTWAESSRDAGHWDGTFWAAPLNNSSQVMYYNKDLLRKAGVEFPSAEPADRWTWQRVVEAAKKVDALGEDRWGFLFDQVNRYYQLQPLPESLGGGSGLTGENNLHVDITNDEWVEAFTWYGNLFNKWEISPKGVGPGKAFQWFSNGKVGFYVGGLWNIGRFKSAGVNFAVAPHPYFEGGRVVTPTGSWHVGMWKYTQNEDAAAKFIRWLTMSEEIGTKWLTGWGQFPARKAVLEYIENHPETYNNQPEIAYKIGRHELLNTAVHRPVSPGYFEFEDVLNGKIEDIRNGADPRSSLRSAQRRIERQLRRFRRR